MKRMLTLFALVALSLTMNAKTVRGYVSDRSGLPVEGLKLVVVRTDGPAGKSVTVTDREGYFEVQVPDETDLTDLVSIFSRKGTKVLSWDNTASGLKITLDTRPTALADNGKIANFAHDYENGENTRRGR